MKVSAFKSSIVITVSAIISASAWAADDVAMGKAEYEAKCAVCHGITG